MKVEYSDNAATVLNASVEPGHTVMIVASASQFPILTGGAWMYVTVEDEVVKVTDTSGNIFTCEAFDQAHGVGASVEIRVVADLLDDIQNADVYRMLTFTILWVLDLVMELLLPVNHMLM